MFALQTDRLLFRHLATDDLDVLAAMYGDADVRRHIPPGCLTRDETRLEIEWFSRGHPRHPQLGLWAAVHRPTQTLIGRCGLLPWTIEGRNEVELAFLLAKPFWGQGLGHEAARAIARHAFETLALPRLVCLIMPDNETSGAVARGLGMRRERDFIGAHGLALQFGMANPVLQSNASADHRRSAAIPS